MNELIYELKPKYDTAKSFYKKAWVEEHHEIKSVSLISYETYMVNIQLDKKTIAFNNDYDNYSVTTLRHVKEFLKQFVGTDIVEKRFATKKQIVANLGKVVNYE